MSEINRQWLLRARPDGMLDEKHFELVSKPVPEAGEGEVLVKSRWLSFEPAMRGWLNDRENYMPPVGIGEVMRGMAVGEVVTSKLAGYAPGDLVSGMTGWQEWVVGGAALQKLPTGASPERVLATGVTGLTAYYGLLEIGEPKAGETVVISGAAGATGSAAGQIARIKGCRAIGIAGGERKCAWLRDELGFDATIDYKSEDVDARLAELCPDGIDVFFDNVGGEILDAALGRLAIGARIVICGSISAYNLAERPPGPRNYYNLVQKRARMQGFVLFDFIPRAAAATAQLNEWIDAGKILWQADVQHGFENAPKTLLRLYSGQNFGKQLLKL